MVKFGDVVADNHATSSPAICDEKRGETGIKLRQSLPLLAISVHRNLVRTPLFALKLDRDAVKFKLSILST